MLKRLILISVVLLFSVSVAHSQELAPVQKVESFFRLVKGGNIGEAYDLLFMGSSIPSLKPQAVQMLKTQTSSGLPLYGAILGFEKVLEERFGGSLVRLVYVLKSEVSPTAWEFYFYKPKGSWFLAKIMFNDQFQLLEAMH